MIKPIRIHINLDHEISQSIYQFMQDQAISDPRDAIATLIGIALSSDGGESLARSQMKIRMTEIRRWSMTQLLNFHHEQAKLIEEMIK